MVVYPFSKIEKKWTDFWLKKKIYEPDFKKAKKPFYNLMMFPYPSAEGLHVGNMYAFTGSDIFGRFKRMKGYDVFEPIGLDGFGIHSENYALKINVHPAKQSKISEKRFYKQLLMIGNGFSWNHRLETYNPDYYRWTQWIFLQLFKNGLAYRKKSPVNWCVSCKTVLADEQVIVGKCERCNGKVVKKELEQWFFRITKYAEKLLKNIDKIDWSEKIKIAQKNWIGQSRGAEIEFKIQDSPPKAGPPLAEKFKIDVFTTRPDTLFGVTYLVLSPESPFIENLEFEIKNLKEIKKYIGQTKRKSEQERAIEDKEKTGVELKGVKAINPASGEKIPIWIADYVLGNVGTGAIMAVPAHDQRDFDFAKKYKLPIKEVIIPQNISVNPREYQRESAREAYEGEGVLINSGEFDGMPSQKAKWQIVKSIGAKKKIQYRLRDWLISRQRYWGPPVPVIFCENCKELLESSKFKIPRQRRVRLWRKNSKLLKSFSRGELENPGWIAVPEKDLPVKLPFIKEFRPTGTGKSPLASVKSFYEAKCPKCGSKAKRETDVSDTFLDSAWYYLGYLILGNKKNKKFNLDKNLIKKWLPVHRYIGGPEHAVLHLFYSRFLAMVFKDLKIFSFEEPFTAFRAHGLIIKEGRKMSKSKGNIVSPDKYIKKFGADVSRMQLMFIGPFEEGGDFRDSSILGIVRFLNRVWDLGMRIAFLNKNEDSFKSGKILPWLHSSTKKITEDIENLRYNTAIAGLMIVLNRFNEFPEKVSPADFKVFIKILAPFAPFITEELWSVLKEKNSIHLSDWPKYDSNLAKNKSFELVIQINGKIRDKCELKIGIKEDEAKKIALAREKIKSFIMDEGQPKGKKIIRIIFVPDKLINIVIAD
ncbi:MAG: Leucine--tRNA ligase [Actinobacteria bacterium]|nr:Leucine--tRNA ligase [Actinomycetota bacterium]